VVFCALIAVVSTIFSVFTLSYAVNEVGISRTRMLVVLIVANVVALAAIPLWAGLSDRIGRKPVFIAGAIGCAAIVWPYMWALSRENYALIFVIGVLFSGVVYSAANGVWPAFYGEMFDTRVRYSGMAIGTQIGFAIAGFAPLISEALLRDGVNGWVPVAVFTSAAALIAAACAATARETHKVHMLDLGKRGVGLPALAGDRA
jgi:MFS family permease